MFDEQDQELGPVLTLVIGIAIVISLFSIAVALSVAGLFSAPSRDSAQDTAPSIEHGAPVGVASPSPSLVKIYFALGSSTLPGDTLDSLQQLAVAAKVDPVRRIEVSGYHDASGDAERNLALAKARAFAVRDALIAAGIPQDRIELRKPTEVLGSTDAQEARRVDVGLR